MNNNVKVSVIIPCYNCEEYIDEAITSLVNQTYKDFEVVCINDGSTDSTQEKLEKWKAQPDLNIRIISQNNMGVSVARNRGISEAKGQYILFLDADDCFSPLSIEKLIDAVSENDAAYCKLTRKYTEIFRFIQQKKCIESNIDAMKKLMYDSKKYNFYAYIYKAELLKENNIIFDVNTKYGEDREFLWKYLCHCKRVAYIDLCLYFYRVNQNSATQRNITWRKTDLIKAMDRVGKYLQDMNSPFANEFSGYMHSRTMWNVAKTFAIAKKIELYKKLIKEYDVSTCMKKNCSDREKLVALSSYFFRINPMLFYFLISLLGK